MDHLGPSAALVPQRDNAAGTSIEARGESNGQPAAHGGGRVGGAVGSSTTGNGSFRAVQGGARA